MHSASNPWMAAEEAADMEPIPMLTVGWVLKETETYVVLVGTRSNDGEGLVGDINCIPKALVSQVTRLADFWKDVSI